MGTGTELRGPGVAGGTIAIAVCEEGARKEPRHCV